MRRSAGWMLLAAGLLGGASVVQPPRLLTGSRVDPTLTAYDRVPPEVALLSVALGGLNGVVVDYLWLRMTEQQEQGRYFEMVQTADWIAALQPRRGRLFAFQAWNLAYNISNEFHDPLDRWRWILTGLQILLQRGVVWSTDDPAVYEELAGIIDDKIVGSLDTYHQDYRQFWYTEWNRLAGERPDWSALADPPTPQQVLAEPAVAAFVAAAQAAGVDDWAALIGAETPPEPGTPAAELLADPVHQPAIARLDLPVRAARLREFWRMDPARMAAIDRDYGPLDWRSGPAHVVYWSLAGIDAAGGRGRDKVLERRLYQALVDAFEAGRVVYTPGTMLLGWPDVRLIPTVERAYDEVLALYADDDWMVASLAASRRGFETTAIVALEATGRHAEAVRRYEALRQQFADDPALRATFDEFVSGQLGLLAAGNVDEVTGLATTFLIQAYATLAAGDADQAGLLEGMARMVYRRYRAEVPDDPNLPPWDDLRRTALTACWQGAVPEALRGGLPPLPEAAP